MLDGGLYENQNFWCCVFGLKEKGSSGIRYIGQTKIPLNRHLNNIIREVMRRPKEIRDTPFDKWVRGCVRGGVRLEIVSLDNNGMLNTTNLSLIKQYRRDGHQLLNTQGVN